MTFRRGAALPVAVTLGHADTCDLGPTAGNGFYKRWPDDLALLADLGVTDLRLTFDWARLQPKPGEFSGAWVERYGNTFDAAQAVGIDVWAALHDQGVPKWFVNEGGLDDAAAITMWWPRWVERVADHLGDRVHGWIPFAEVPAGLPDQPWIDTWDILAGGEPDVVLSCNAERLGFASRHTGRFDRLGVAIDALGSDALAAEPGRDRGADAVDGDADAVDGDTDAVDGVDDGLVDRAAGRWHDALGEANDIVSGNPLIVSRFTLNHDDPEVDGRLMERMVGVLDRAITNGVEIAMCLVEPAIAGPDSARALLDSARKPFPAAEVYLGPPTDD